MEDTVVKEEEMWQGGESATMKCPHCGEEMPTGILTLIAHMGECSHRTVVDFKVGDAGTKLTTLSQMFAIGCRVIRPEFLDIAGLTAYNRPAKPPTVE